LVATRDIASGTIGALWLNPVMSNADAPQRDLSRHSMLSKPLAMDGRGRGAGQLAIFT
jgi:hypothetical protein